MPRVAPLSIAEANEIARAFEDAAFRREQADQEIRNLARFPSENPDPILRVDQDGVLMYANEPSRKLLQEWKCAVGGHVPGFWCDLTTQALKTGANQIVDIECDATVYSLFVAPVAAGDYVTLYGHDVTERKRAEESLRRLSHELLRSQDEERKRIARDLHDSLAQQIAAICMSLDKVRQTPNEVSADMGKILSEARNQANESRQEIRTLSYLLHPPLLDDLGLIPALHAYVDGFSKRSGIEVTLDLPQKIDEISSEGSLTLSRVVQEALANVHRHSESPTATIRISRSARDELVLEVSDRGCGMPSKKDDRSDEDAGSFRVGIPGMRERLRQFDGRLEINSCEQGTTVRALFPIKHETPRAD